jgi:protease-4
MNHRHIVLGLLSLSLFAKASPNGSMSFERTTSVSNAYDSRSVFVNPAALAFDTELNGADLLGSFAYGINSGHSDDLAASLSYGYFGAGLEHLSTIRGKFNRYSFAWAAPITPYVFLGGRYSFTRSDYLSLTAINSFDAGFQFRPRRDFSLGFQVNSINSPTVRGVSYPAEFIVGTTVKPLKHVELSADIRTNSNRFFNVFNYRASVGLELLAGLKARVGYDDQEKFQVGIQFNLDRTSVYSIAQTAADTRGLITGVQVASQPFASAIRPKSVYKIEVDSSVREEGSHGGMFGKDKPSLLGLLRRLDRAQRDPSVAMVVIKIDSFSLGLAAAQDVREAITRCREAGKHVEVFLSNASVKEYLIASAADRIHMEPSAELRFLGPRAESYYLKGTLDKIGVEGQFLARGKYKSAPEMFTRQDASPIHRDEVMHELELSESILVSLLSKSRGINRQKWNELQQIGLLDAETAKAQGLVDAIDHLTEADENWPHGVRESIAVRSTELVLPPRVAVIVAEGDILGKRIPLLSFAGNAQVTPHRLQNRFKAALSDPRTGIIVLRVSSPGGEVVASDEIASFVEEAKRKKKSVIVSMGDVAASGGYMISAPADRIFAQDLSVTGSIGVFLGKFNLGNLYKKIELHKEILSRAPYAGLLTEDRAWTTAERDVLLRRLNQYYDSFVGYVAKNRRITKDQAETAAQGRVYLGAEALAHKLIDQKGGYYDAIQYAANQMGYAPTEYQSWLVEDPKSLFELFDAESVFASTDALGSLSELGMSPLLGQIEWMARFKQSPFLYWSPIQRFEN